MTCALVPVEYMANPTHRGALQQLSQIALASKTYEVENFAAAQELYHNNGWTDGLPVVPPTQSAVAACLEWALMPPDQLIGIEPVREQPITAEKLAINAVMAGCLPMHFPIVWAAWPGRDEGKI